MKYLLVVQLYGNLSITTATSEINETVESMSRFLTTNRNIELLEPYEGKLSRTVLRGEGGSNALDLPDISKQGDFFVESPIILLASIIWYLKIYKNGKYCTFPPCHRVPEPQVRRHFSHPHLVPGAGELPFSLHGRMGILSGGAVTGADSQCQDTAFPHDLPGALLG